MKRIRLNDLDLLSIGHEIQLFGAIYSGGGVVYMVPLPDENPDDLDSAETKVLCMDAADMERFLRQTDLLDVQGPGKAILRKSQRQIDAALSWRVFERDGYKCRYCGRKGPLTVDHVDRWEDNGATVEPNLISACRRCNKQRGRMAYADWIQSSEYAFFSQTLTQEQKDRNQAVVATIPSLVKLRVTKQRSR